MARSRCTQRGIGIGGTAGGERIAEFAGAAVVDFGGADGTQPDVAAGFQAAVVGAAVLDPDLDLRADGGDAAVALAFGLVRVGGRECAQVHPGAAAPSGGIVAVHEGVVRDFASIPRLCVYTETVRSQESQEKVKKGRMIGGLLRFAPGRLRARKHRAPWCCGVR
jgi:hypothetical protein